MKYTDEELQKLHRTLYEILAVVDAICRKHDIRYFVTGGTAIGVHFWQGLIPWDDDIDIGMTRPNYERFLAVAPQELGSDYFLQTPETELHSPFFFAKVRKNNTEFSEQQFAGIKMHQGIFVDIFPFDKMPMDKRKEKWQYDMLHFLNGLFIAKDIWQWRHCGHCDVKEPRERGFLPCLMTRIIISIVPKRAIFRAMKCVQTWYNNSDSTECKNIITRSEHLPIADATETEQRPLGMLMVQTARNLENYLTNHYGKIQKDYPEELRVNHRPERLRFSN